MIGIFFKSHISIINFYNDNDIRSKKVSQKKSIILAKLKAETSIIRTFITPINRIMSNIKKGKDSKENLEKINWDAKDTYTKDIFRIYKGHIATKKTLNIFIHSYMNSKNLISTSEIC